jgi:hypothetical protein
MPKYHRRPFWSDASRIARLVGILGRGRRIGDRGIDDRAGGHLQSLGREVPMYLVSVSLDLT